MEKHRIFDWYAFIVLGLIDMWKDVDFKYAYGHQGDSKRNSMISLAV